MKLSALAKRLFLLMGILTSLGCVVALIVWPHITNLVPGILLGTVVAMLRFLALEASINNTLALEDPKKATQMARISYALRQLLTGVVLLIAALNSTHVNLLGTLFGIFTLQVAVHIHRLLDKKQPRSTP